MARTRYIKPDFFDDPDIAKISPKAKLLYIALWQIMDRTGVCEYEPLKLKKYAFGYDEMAIDVLYQLIDELKKGNFIIVIDHNSHTYLYCPTLPIHQLFHRDEKPKNLIPMDILANAVPDRCKHGVSTNDVSASTPGNYELVTMNCERSTGSKEPRVMHWLGKLWNENCGKLPKVVEINASRTKAINLALKESDSKEVWLEVIKRIASDKFCNGSGARGWRANFDWMLKPNRRAQVLEGNYGAEINPFKVEIETERKETDWFKLAEKK